MNFHVDIALHLFGNVVNLNLVPFGRVRAYLKAKRTIFFQVFQLLEGPFGRLYVEETVYLEDRGRVQNELIT